MLTQVRCRPARLEDKAWVCGLARTRFYPDHPVTGVSGRQQADWTAGQYAAGWESLLARPNLTILVDSDQTGYLVAVAGDRESLTGDRQIMIADWVGDLALFLPPLREMGQRDGSRYLVTRAFPGQSHPLAELGFQAELTRVMARLDGRPNTSNFVVRRAGPGDRLFMANLHRQGSHFYAPAHRRVDPEEISMRNLTVYMGMDLRPGSSMLGYLVCEGRRPFGYVLFKRGLRAEVSGAAVAYLYDIHLQPERWGRSAARILLRQAMLELSEMGLELIAGDVSCANPGVHQLALRAADFRHEWTRWGLELMPGSYG